MTPLNDWVLVRKFETDKVMPSGVILPDSATGNHQVKGECLAVGPGRYRKDRLIPTETKPGDIVVYSRYVSAVEIDPNDKQLVLMREVEILAVVEP